MSLSRYQNAGQNREMKVAHESFENVTKSLGTTVMRQLYSRRNYEQIKNRGTLATG
jgi:hypothetical protein